MLLAMKREQDDADHPQEPPEPAGEYVDIVQVQRFLRHRPPIVPYNVHAHNPPNVEDWFTLWFNNTGD